MSIVIADNALKSLLSQFREPTEIRDEGGNLLGHFTPATDSLRKEANAYAEVRKLFDPEEIKRRKERSRNDPGRTLEQIMERLQSSGSGQ